MKVFGAKPIERHDMEHGSHVELQIGDSVLVIEAGKLPPGFTPTMASIYVYVPDVDEAVRRALELGATSIAEVEDKPYQERSAGVKDTFGNTWYLSTYTGDGPPK